MSSRALKRQEQKKKRQRRAESLVEIYGTSAKIHVKLNRLENKGAKTAADYRSIETLKEKYEFLKKYEDGTVPETKRETQKQEATNLKAKSVFYDPELNPLGKQPYPELLNLPVSRIKKKDQTFTNLAQVEADSIRLPTEPQPQFYKLKGVQQSYQSEDWQ